MMAFRKVVRPTDHLSTPGHRRSAEQRNKIGVAHPAANSAERAPMLRSVRTLLMGIALSVLSFGPALAERTIEGRVTVVRDVDTIVVAGTPVRLNGVDGPETSNRAGREARTFMERLVHGRTVACVLDGDRTYDRWVGVCYLDGQDIGAVAIANGHALDCRRYSGGRYAHLETPAARARLPRSGYCR
jgi:micrococcal nuclease